MNKGFMERNPRTRLFKRVEGTGKELRNQVLAYSNIKLHSNFLLLKVLPSNFIFLSKTEVVFLPFLSHSIAPLSVSLGDKAYIPQVHYEGANLPGTKVFS